MPSYFRINRPKLNDEIISFCQKRYISYSKFPLICGLSSSFMSPPSCTKGHIRPQTLQAICEVLEISPESVKSEYPIKDHRPWPNLNGGRHFVMRNPCPSCGSEGEVAGFDYEDDETDLTEKYYCPICGHQWKENAE